MAQPRTRLQIPGFQLMECLGSGARSTIWRVREQSRNRYYAFKRVYKQPGDDDRYFDQAINEFRVARHFDHPTVRKYYRLRRRRRWLHTLELRLLMELCEGNTCQARRATDVGKVVAIFLKVADGLIHIHARGHVHADIKPKNIVVADDGTVKIIDFGQSCPIGTVKERIQGTPDFIAPEQVRRRPLDPRTDVFNLGASLYWTLTGQAIPTILPKADKSVQLVNDMVVTPPQELNADVPPGLSRLVMDCIEFKPSRRPQRMTDVAGRLDLVAHTLGRNGNDQAPDEPQEEFEDIDQQLDQLLGPPDPDFPEEPFD